MDCTFYQWFTWAAFAIAGLIFLYLILDGIDDAARKRKEWRERRERCDEKNSKDVSILKTRVDNLINCINGKHEFTNWEYESYAFPLPLKHCHWCGASEPKMSTKKGGK